MIARWLAAASLVLALTGCTTTNIDLVVDRRVDITAPAEASHVQNPVTVSWDADDLEVVEPGSGTPGVYFAVFDGDVRLRPGAALITLADEQCRRTVGCATRSYFAERGIYVTSANRITLDQLDEGEEHDLAIVLMDGATDRRVGEAIFHVAFYVDEPADARELTPEDFES